MAKKQRTYIDADAPLHKPGYLEGELTRIVLDARAPHVEKLFAEALLVLLRRTSTGSHKR